MVLAKVTNENLIAGLLFRFRKTNNLEIDIYRNILLEKYGYRLSPFAVDIRGIMDYMIKINNTFYMIDTSEVSELFNEKQGEEFSNIIKDIDLEEVVLRKFEKIGSVLEYMIPTLFNSEEEQIINKLLDNMSLIYVWSCDEENVMELQLTSIGKERLQSIKDEGKEKKELKK